MEHSDVTIVTLSEIIMEQGYFVHRSVICQTKPKERPEEIDNAWPNDSGVSCVLNCVLGSIVVTIFR